MALCECGCGQGTEIAFRTDTRKGWIKGQPLRFVRFHHPHGFQKGEQHPHWKGDEVGYVSLHQWVNRQKEKTGKCSTCSHVGYTEWANISGLYFRDPDDFAELCRLCHEELDRFTA